MSKFEDEAKKLEDKLKKLELIAHAELTKLEGATKKWGWYYVALVVGITILSGYGAAVIDDLNKFLVEVLPPILLSLVIGLLFLRRSDETVKTTTAIIHKALSHEMAEMHSKVDSLRAMIEKDKESIAEIRSSRE